MVGIIGLLSLLLITVFGVLFVISLIRKKSKKFSGIGLLCSVILFIVMFSLPVEETADPQAIGSTQSPTPTIQPTATPTLTPTPSIAPTATPSIEPTTTPTIEPTSTPAPTETPAPTITLISITSPVSRNEQATVTVQGKPNTEYSISVYYSTTASNASGLEKKTSDADGIVSWTWKIGGSTNSGNFYLRISEGKESLRVDFTVK